MSPASENSNTPYATLTPDCLLDALDSVGLTPDGRLLALNSFENRVYQVGMDEGPPLVVKFYRPGRWSAAAIQEEHDFTLDLAERELPVVAPLRLTDGATLHSHAGFLFAVYPRRGGRMPEFDSPDTLEWMGRFIGRIHAVGALQPYRHRPTLDIASFGEQSRDFILAGDWLPADLLPAWQSVVEQALQGVRHCYARAGQVAHLRLHGDCHAGNVLWTEGSQMSGPHFVDFDDSRMGPAVQDLWMLLSGDHAGMSRQMCDVLAGYDDFAEFDRRELHLIEALRTLRLLHHSAWIARRWDDPAFPAAFPWFNTAHYWQERILELREQIALMEEEPLYV
ncbi:MAG: serine/threonine protein kinase [Pseudomonadota bacterium]|nr:serine/threonine protein kinase [Pseudomonadota bacterium]